MPMALSQSFFGPSAGQFASQPDSLEMPFRFGPRHCGQSSARAEGIRTSNEMATSPDKNETEQDARSCFIIKNLAYSQPAGRPRQLELGPFSLTQLRFNASVTVLQSDTKRHRAAALQDAVADSQAPVKPPGFGLRQPSAALARNR